MTPNVQFIPTPVSGFLELAHGTTTSSVTTRYYVTHVNVIGNAIWDGRGANNSWYFNTPFNQIQFYFANDADRATALASYSTWRIVGTDGTSEVVTPTTMGSSRLRWTLSTSFSAFTKYTIEGQA